MVFPLLPFLFAPVGAPTLLGSRTLTVGSPSQSRRTTPVCMLAVTRQVCGQVLKDAVRQAEALGILTDAHGCRRAAAATASSGPQRSGNAAANSPPPSDDPSRSGGAAVWASIESRQKALYSARRTVSSADTVGTPHSLNVIHIEGTVAGVECGYGIHHQEGTGEAVRHVVTVEDTESAHVPQLQLWLNVAEEGCAVPLAVRCLLSGDAVDAAWRSTTAPQSQAECNHSFCDKLRGYMLSVRRELLHKRVIVSGVLKEELLYDADANGVVAVPVVHLPMDGLASSHHVIT